jgi:hypothetical protein
MSFSLTKNSASVRLYYIYSNSKHALCTACENSILVDGVDYLHGAAIALLFGLACTLSVIGGGSRLRRLETLLRTFRGLPGVWG